MSGYAINEKVKAWVNKFREDLSKVTKRDLALDGDELNYFFLGEVSGKTRKILNISFEDPGEQDTLDYLNDDTKFSIIVIVMEDLFHNPVHKVRPEIE